MAFVEPTWPKDQIAILLITRADNGEPVQPPARLDGAFNRIELGPNLEVRLNIVTLDASAAANLDRCGVAVRGDGGAIGPILSYYVSGPIDASKDRDVRLETAPAQDARELGLTFATADCGAPFDCSKLSVHNIPVDVINREILAIAAYDEHTVYFAPRTDGPAPSLVYKAVDDVASPFITTSAFGQVYSLAYDGRGTLWATTIRFEGLKLDLDGNVLATVRTPTTSNPSAVSAGIEGTVLAWGPLGVHMIAGDLGGTDPDALETLTSTVEMLALSSSDHIVAIADSAFQFFNGTIWQTERDVGPSTFESWHSVDVTPDSAYVAGRYELVASRDERGNWHNISEVRDPNNRLGIRAVAALGKDRFAVGGDAGFLAFYSAGTWCTLSSGFPNIFEVAAASPSKHVVWFGGRYSDATMSHPVLVRVDIAD